LLLPVLLQQLARWNVHISARHKRMLQQLLRTRPHCWVLVQTQLQEASSQRRQRFWRCRRLIAAGDLVNGLHLQAHVATDAAQR
jgi:hypothetical protein